MKNSILISLLIISLSIPIVAQWSNDPAENSPIAVASGEQAIPKIATSENGTTYISWFSNETGNYNVKLQKLDVFGNMQWDSAGLLVSNHEAMSWLTEWDMTIDQEDHAILTFQDIRTGNNNIYAYRISPEGTFIWGDDGLELSNSTAFDASPKVTVTNAGNAVFAWHVDSVVIIQKVSPDGEKQWGENGIMLNANNRYSWPQLIAVGDDDVILKYFDYSGSLMYPTRHVLAQRYDSNGEAIWTQPAIVSNAGGIAVFTQIFPFINDGNDGFYIAWHDDRDNNMLASIFVQHVGSDGPILFADDGIEASVMPNRNHFYAELALPPGSDDVFVFWNEMDANQNDRGIYGQKISSSGERLWTDNGKSFIEISSTNVYPVAARNSETDMVVIYEEYFNAIDTGIKAMRIDTDGNYIWTEEKITMSSVQSEKLHCVANDFLNGQWIFVWEDRRNGNGDIFGQNIKLDGSLGPITYAENIVIEPDSVYCPPSWNEESVFIINNGILPVEILNFPLANFLPGWEWYITNFGPNFPFVIEPSDSLELIIQIIIYTGDSYELGWDCDWVYIETETNNYVIEICVDTDLLNVNSNKINSSIVSCFPNPANDIVTFEIEAEKNIDFEISIIDSFGNLVKSLINHSAKKVIWDCTNNNNQKVPPGTYYYKIISEKFQNSGKIILLD